LKLSLNSPPFPCGLRLRNRDMVMNIITNSVELFRGSSGLQRDRWNSH
jgi:hypothetical protein